MSATAQNRLHEQMAFLLETEKLKQILRRTTPVGSDRRENSAEHSWQLAVMALLLAEYANSPLDRAHTIELLLVHDLVEIDAGDTFAYDLHANQDKAEREEAAANRLFGLLPPDQNSRLRTLWEEFEAGQSPEARFAVALDRLMPALQNYANDGGTWRTPGVDLAAIYRRLAPIGAGSTPLWEYVQTLLDDAVTRGLIRP
ncbi:MAG: HD domain-containing protein [Caldilinea sp.]